MRVDVFTIFPALVDTFCGESLLGRARRDSRLDLRCHDLRQHTTDVHHSVDDAPFGGGAGMVLRPEPVFASVEHANPPRPLLLLGPGGRTFDQVMARELAALDGFSLMCGRYEGVDHRIREHLCDGEISIGGQTNHGLGKALCRPLDTEARTARGRWGVGAAVYPRR